METNVRTDVIRRALQVAGGVEELAAHLGIAAGTTRLFVRGILAVPQSVFLRAVDLLGQADPIEPHQYPPWKELVEADKKHPS